VNIRNAVRKVANKKGTTALLRYSDIIPFLGGSAAAGPFAGIGGVAINRAVENPATRFAGAKISQGLLSGTSSVAKNPITTKALHGLFNGNANIK
jgi:hypothetical protein